MDLWIRSQDKRALINTRRIDVDDNRIITWDEGKYASDVLMGEYKTRERALEVLDEIQNAILGIICNEDIEAENKKKYTGIATASEISQNIVYEMPKE